MPIGTIRYLAVTVAGEQDFAKYQDAHQFVIDRRREGETAILQTQQWRGTGWLDIGARLWQTYEPAGTR